MIILDFQPQEKSLIIPGTVMLREPYSLVVTESRFPHVLGQAVVSCVKDDKIGFFRKHNSHSRQGF